MREPCVAYHALITSPSNNIRLTLALPTKLFTNKTGRSFGITVTLKRSSHEPSCHGEDGVMANKVTCFLRVHVEVVPAALLKERVDFMLRKRFEDVLGVHFVGNKKDVYLGKGKMNDT